MSNRKEEWANTGSTVAAHDGVWSVGYRPLTYSLAIPEKPKPKAAPLGDVGNDSGDTEKNEVK